MGSKRGELLGNTLAVWEAAGGSLGNGLPSGSIENSSAAWEDAGRPLGNTLVAGKAPAGLERCQRWEGGVNVERGEGSGQQMSSTT